MNDASSCGDVGSQVNVRHSRLAKLPPRARDPAPLSLSKRWTPSRLEAVPFRYYSPRSPRAVTLAVSFNNGRAWVRVVGDGKKSGGKRTRKSGDDLFA